MVKRIRCIDHNDCYFLVYNGKMVLSHESYQITSNVEYALNNPKHWDSSECQELADAIRK